MAGDGSVRRIFSGSGRREGVKMRDGELQTRGPDSCRRERKSCKFSKSGRREKLLKATTPTTPAFFPNLPLFWIRVEMGAEGEKR